MPIPSKKPNEDRKSFLSRCMADDVMKKEYSDSKKRVAVCLSKASEEESESLLSSVHDALYAETSNWDDYWNEFTWEVVASEVYDEDGKTLGAEYQGRKVNLNKPFRTPDGPKKFSVYVKNPKGNIVKVNFGDPNMKIKKSDPARRKSFRARHNCDNPGPKHKARYWSCKKW